MRRTIVGFVFVLFAAASAQAVTIRDIIDLTKAGLSDDVMLALIEVDGRVFSIDTPTLTQLKAAGVSPKVIIALVRSGRVSQQPEPLPTTFVQTQPMQPQIVYVEQPGPIVVREVVVPVAVPVYVAVPISRRGTHQGPGPGAGTEGRSAAAATPSPGGPYLTDIPAPVTTEPVYWGSGGKLRPDAWKPK